MAAAFNQALLLISFIIIMIVPMFMPTTTVSAIRVLHQNSTPSKSPSEGTDSNNMLAVHYVGPQELHEKAFSVLMKGRITPSGPSHKGHAAPTRHLLRKVDIPNFQFQELISAPSTGVRPSMTLATL